MSDPYRQSALLLHGLNADDRQWMLAHLAEDQRAQLNGYLAELQELGMPADRSLAENLLARGAGGTVAARHAGEPASFGAALRAASAEAVLHVLGEQPSWLIATVLSIEPWPWRESIYVGVDASKRERIKQCLGERPPLLLAQSLVAELEARLPETAQATSGAPERQSAWTALKQKFKHLTQG